VYEALAASCERVLDRHHWLERIDVETGEELSPGGRPGTAPGRDAGPGVAAGSGVRAGVADGAGSGPGVASGRAAGPGEGGSGVRAGVADGAASGAGEGGSGSGVNSAVGGDGSGPDTWQGAASAVGRGVSGKHLAGPLLVVRDTARAVLAEYARVREAGARAAEAVEEAGALVAGLVRRIRGEAPANAPEWVRRLGELRRAQGRLATLRETRYADLTRLDALAESLSGGLADAGRRAADCFADEHAFDSFRERAAELAERAAALDTAAGGDALTAELDELAAGLATVTETASGLDIADATVRTRILASAADVLAAVNRARALLDARRRELAGAESAAEFAAETALLAQSVSGALAAADTPEACELHLGRLLVQVEDLTTRFAADPERLAALAERGDEIQQALTARKQALADERAQRAARLASSAERILDTVRRRAAALGSADEVNAYFAGDPLAAEHRKVTEQLRALGDPAKAAELTAALAAAREDTARTLRDRADLYEDAGATIRLGRHRFAVNTQPLDLALVPHGDGLAFTVTGTDYVGPVRDEGLTSTRRFWSRPLVSESPEVYRAEYLAATLLMAAPGFWGEGSGLAAGSALPRRVPDPPAAPAGARLRGGGSSRGAGNRATGHDDAGGTSRAKALGERRHRPEGAVAAVAGSEDRGGSLARLVRDALAGRVDEGYQQGVHDHDAELILRGLVQVASTAGLLRYTPGVRAGAQLFWAYGVEAGARAAWGTRARSLARAGGYGGGAAELGALCGEVGEAAVRFLGGLGLGGEGARVLGEYLVSELAAEEPGFVRGEAAASVAARFAEALGGADGVAYKELLGDLDALGGDLRARWQLALAWLGAFGGADGDHLEAAAELLCGEGGPVVRYPAPGGVDFTVDGLLGDHPRVRNGTLRLRLDELLARVRRFEADEVPAYRAYRRHRASVVAAERERLDLAAYRPRPLTGFVRNRLIDEVYLPLVGDSLAKQFGTAGGLLMLLSPPGYGKTTLVEYVAARLGLALVTVSGPALGTGVTSLDPERAPDATARREVEKLVLALSLGSNVLLHLDDIQHTSPELLQKFIPLCDATRRIEGPGGTYDLRGKRFAVCMSGNPYTESGTLFRVPDMLANRADVWNLGDVLTGREDVFALSYVENALTANPLLAPLAGRDRRDLDLLLRLAAADPTARADALTHPYQPGELASVTAVLAQALRVRDVLLTVNAAYVSAASGDGPPFLLQGSYRDMSRLTARLHPSLTREDVDALIADHYRGEAHALASGASAALRGLAELTGLGPT
jgi:hypothetical protein